MDNNFFPSAILFICGGVLTYIGAAFLRLRAKLIEQGKRTTATVTNVSLSTITRGAKRNKRRVTVYNCNLEFMDGNRTQTIKHETESPRAVGETIEIAYLPDNPGKFMEVEQLTDSFKNKIIPLTSIITGVIVMIIGVVVFF